MYIDVYTSISPAFEILLRILTHAKMCLLTVYQLQTDSIAPREIRDDMFIALHWKFSGLIPFIYNSIKTTHWKLDIPWYSWYIPCVSWYIVVYTASKEWEIPEKQTLQKRARWHWMHPRSLQYLWIAHAAFQGGYGGRWGGEAVRTIPNTLPLRDSSREYGGQGPPYPVVSGW